MIHRLRGRSIDRFMSTTLSLIGETAMRSVGSTWNMLSRTDLIQVYAAVLISITPDSSTPDPTALVGIHKAGANVSLGVYPAAALAAHDIDAGGYKASSGGGHRERVLSEPSQRIKVHADVSAIDRATRWAYVNTKAHKDARSAVAFLKAVRA